MSRVLSKLTLPLREKLAPLAAPAVLTHAARTTVAALLALWLAFFFQLDTPYSAMTTVLVVAHPVQGSILAKSLYRLGGTLLGAAAAVVLMALFAQSPILFIIGFALWLAAGAGASTLLRGFRSYGAVLAGYTVALISLPAVSHPKAIFTLALARVAVVSLGIASSALVGALLTGHTAERSLEKLLRSLLLDLLASCRLALRPEQADALRPLRRALAGRLGELDAAIQFAAAETSRVAGQAAVLRDASAGMFGALTAAPALTESLGAADAAEPSLAEKLREAESLLTRAEADIRQGDFESLERQTSALGGLRERLEAAFDVGADNVAPELVVVIDRFADMIGELELSLLGLTRLKTGGGLSRARRNVTHLDWRWAGVNAARAAVAVVLLGAVWFGFGWPAGGTMLATAAPMLGLLAMRERPSADAADMFWGMALGSLTAFFFLLWVLPQIAGFPLLAMWLGPVLFCGAAAMTQPRLMFGGIGFAVFFITLLAPSNPMRYDPEVFINNALATLAGGALASIVYRVVLPVDAQGLRRHLLAEIRRDLADLLRRIRPVASDEWEGRMHDRLRLLTARLRAANIRGDTSLRNGFAALRLGRDIFRLRSLLAADGMAQEIARDVLAGLTAPHKRNIFARTIAALRAHAERLDPEPAAKILRAAAILPAIEALAAEHRRFFRQVLQ